jgi:hypothetical protein
MITGQVTNDELLGIYFANFASESSSLITKKYNLKNTFKKTKKGIKSIDLTSITQKNLLRVKQKFNKCLSENIIDFDLDILFLFKTLKAKTS